VKLSLVQHACDEDPETNLERVHDGIAHAAADGAELVVLQELHNGPYFCVREEVRAFDLAEPVPGPTTDRLARHAADYGVVVVGSVFERRSAGVYHNTAVVLDSDGRFAGRYRKAHIPDDPGYSEKFYFTPGDTGFEPIDTRVGRLGLLVCWDQWFPEAARLMALAGADILLYPTAIGFDPADDADEQARQLDAWVTVQRGHAIANGLPLATCNRVGAENGNDFWGNSFVCGPQGEILARAGDDPAVLTVEIDRSRSEQIRRIWPFLRDRRIDAYGDLLRRFRD
jgi:N-carbamoylputrescine amidase